MGGAATAQFRDRRGRRGERQLVRRVLLRPGSGRLYWLRRIRAGARPPRAPGVVTPRMDRTGPGLVVDYNRCLAPAGGRGAARYPLHHGGKHLGVAPRLVADKGLADGGKEAVAITLSLDSTQLDAEGSRLSIELAVGTPSDARRLARRLCRLEVGERNLLGRHALLNPRPVVPGREQIVF